MVLFRVWFICLLVERSYVCKLVFQSVGWGYVWFWVCLFVGWWLCDSIISLTLGMVSVLNFFYYRFKPIPWILSYKWADYLFIYFFLCGLLLLCVLPWVICFMFGVVWVLGFFLYCDKSKHRKCVRGRLYSPRPLPLPLFGLKRTEKSRYLIGT